MSTYLLLKLPNSNRQTSVLVVSVWLHSCRHFSFDIKIQKRWFNPDRDHIEWLCECHEWLRPYFPYWGW
ncbi:hypothetical protein [Lyngbya sp. CCY1209]|uniref:hypothetical protein n=1 Tax=Lyngbya sp. CCY1209 TaxID=2886103 RepID=UPI002D20182A|nr:hypothetical protein [Lyngbya sp. CCY1209]MEB3881949.1 hypothetical protein [Lyngbya sp. CCY1209]